MKIFPATESFFDDDEWWSYYEVLVMQIERTGIEVLDCSAEYVLPIVPLLDKLLDDDARHAIFPAVNGLFDAMFNHSILSCDRVLVLLDGDDDHQVSLQVSYAALHHKPMDGYRSDGRRLPGDKLDPDTREMYDMITASGGVIATSLDELVRVYADRIASDPMFVKGRRKCWQIPASNSTIPAWPGPKRKTGGRVFYGHLDS